LSVFVEKFTVGKNINLTVAVKDNIDVKGFVTKAGSAAYADNKIASENSDVVNNILNAGCKLVGKLNMHELAFGMTGVNKFFGTPVNYHYPHYITGGSSSGCAVAVAEGPLAASASKIIDAMNIIDSTFKAIELPESICLGQVNVKADQSILTVVNQALNQDFITTKNIHLSSLEQAFDDALVLMNAEMWDSFGTLLDTNKLGEDVAQRLAKAKNISPEALAKAEQVRQIFTEEVDLALSKVDALVLPTLASFPLSREDALAGKADLTISLLTRPFNLSGHPAITIPLCNKLGKPIAMQLVGAKGQDELICGIAKKISESSSINIPMLEKNNV